MKKLLIIPMLLVATSSFAACTEDEIGKAIEISKLERSREAVIRFRDSQSQKIVEIESKIQSVKNGLVEEVERIDQ